jgi:hypothetical protein
METALKVRVGVDYLTASKPREERPWEWVHAIGKTFESTGECVHWKHGYEGVLICGGYGMVLRRDHRDLAAGDMLVRLPGQAVQWIKDRNMLSESELKCTDADLCRYFVENGFSATRIDVAMDTNDPEVSPRLVENLIKARSFTGRAKRAGINNDWDIHKPETIGEEQTFYIGKRTSSRFMRVYNKRAEVLKSRGEDVGHLTRFELEVKGEAATKVLQLIAQYAVVLGLTRSASTPEKKVRWLKKGVSKTLLLAAKYGFADEIKAAMHSKEHAISDTEHEQWEQHQKNCEARRSKQCQSDADNSRPLTHTDKTGVCELCGVKTDDWIVFDGAKGTCKCRRCYYTIVYPKTEGLKDVNEAGRSQEGDSHAE